jgi:hypothetical protein
MAGTLAFYNGMMPGITKAVSSVADDTPYYRGQRVGAQTQHDLASAEKLRADAEKTYNDINNHNQGGMNFVMGTHGVNGKALRGYQQSMDKGEDWRGAAFAQNPGVAPDKTRETLNLALRDLGAFQYGPEKAAKYATEMAQLPAVQGAVGAAQRNDAQSAADIMRFQASLGKDVMQDKTFNWFASQPPEVQRAFTGLQQAVRPNNGTTVMTPVPMKGPNGETVYGYPSKAGGEIQPTTARVPEKEKPDPNMSQVIARKLIEAEKAKAQGQPAAPAATPPGIPPGAKQIGTSKGKAVYEINGKRYIAE